MGGEVGGGWLLSISGWGGGSLAAAGKGSSARHGPDPKTMKSRCAFLSASLNYESGSMDSASNIQLVCI